MAIDDAELKAELETDPRGYGYGPYLAVGDMVTPANLLQLIRDGTNGGPIIHIKRADISSAEVFHALDLSDLKATPGQPELQWLNAILIAPFPIRLLFDDLSETPVQINLLALLRGGASPTKTRLTALETRLGNRGEELFGAGTMITHEDVTRAIRSGS